jgi:glycosyltransferase involved in cell wall biosynthesis
MKIALITGEYWPYIRGGCGISTTLLVHQLKRRGLLVDVYVFDKQHSPILTDKGSTVYYKVTNDRLWPLVNLQAIMKLWKKLGHYDLVHVYSTIQMAALGFLRRAMLKIPVVATLNGEEAACIYYQRWMRVKCKECSISHATYCAFRAAKETETLFVPAPVLATYFIIQRALAQNLDKYFALSNVMKEMYVSCGFPKEKITLIPNMYDPMFLKKLEQAKVEKRDEKIVVLYAGRLTKAKGVEDLIKAFSLVNSKKAELWIVGHGPEERRLREIAERTNREKKIKFLGFVSYDDLPIIYKKAHIFVHPARWPEPFGRTILEAMLAKLAIIASDSGAPSEVLGDTGIIYEIGNISELSRKLEMLIDNNEIRNELGIRAYNKAVKDYTPDAITDRVIDEYRNLL